MITLQKEPRIVDHLDCLGASEDGKPPDYCARKKVGAVILPDAKTGASHGSPSTRSVRTCVPTQERGNEKK
jgi:hypothetical protein